MVVYSFAGKKQIVGGEINFGKQYRQGNRVYSSDHVAMALNASPVGNMGGYSYLYVVMEEPIANEFSFYYYSQRNKLIVKIMEMIKAKKSKYQSNIEQLKGGLIS